MCAARSGEVQTYHFGMLSGLVKGGPAERSFAEA